MAILETPLSMRVWLLRSQLRLLCLPITRRPRHPTGSSGRPIDLHHELSDKCAAIVRAFARGQTASTHEYDECVARPNKMRPSSKPGADVWQMLSQLRLRSPPNRKIR